MKNNINITSWVIGEKSTNVYLIQSDKYALLIDPASDADLLIKNIANKQIEKLDGIILTHTHFDHIGAANDLKNYYKTEIFDYKFLNNKNDISTRQVANFSNLDIKILFTPGHTFDSTSILINQKSEYSIEYFNQIENLYGIKNKDEYVKCKCPVLFTGDSLFYESNVKENYDSSLLTETKRTFEMFKELNDNTLVFPGHGLPTSIKHEKEHSLKMF